MRFRRIRTKDKGSEPNSWDYVEPMLSAAQVQWRDSPPFSDPKVALLGTLVEHIVGMRLDIAYCLGEPTVYQVMPADGDVPFSFWRYWVMAGQQWYERPEDALFNFAFGYLHWKALGMPTENAE